MTFRCPGWLFCVLTLAVGLVFGSIPAFASNGCLAREERFSTRLVSDFIAHAMGANLPADPVPKDLPKMTDPALANISGVLHRMRDMNGDAIGLASQIGHGALNAKNERVMQTSWTLTIPGRGSLFLSEEENLGPVLALVDHMKRDSSTRGSDIVTTVGPREDGRGIIVGGSGEFSGCTGSFVEIEGVRSVDPKGGAAGGMIGEIDLHLWFLK